MNENEKIVEAVKAALDTLTEETGTAEFICPVCGGKAVLVKEASKKPELPYLFYSNCENNCYTLSNQ